MSLAVKGSTSLAVQTFSGPQVKLSSKSTTLVVKRPTSLEGIQRSIPYLQPHMVLGTFVTARICEFFVERLCSGLLSISFSVSPPPIPYFSSFHGFITMLLACDGGSTLGYGDLPAMGAVFYLGAGWPRW